MPQGQLEAGDTLADLIMRKIADQEAGKEQPEGLYSLPIDYRLLTWFSSSARPGPPPGFNPKILEVYTKVGNLLSRYKSGPLPKAFKILPTLSMWPTLLMLTNPEDWTPHATYAATKIFASNLDPKQSQKFYKEILLSKVREEIGSVTNKLSVQTYMALKKSIYKPAAFFKGILFPLCEVSRIRLLGRGECADESCGRVERVLWEKLLLLDPFLQRFLYQFYILVLLYSN